MNTKLTLTLDQTVIEKGKIYAKKQGRSLSKLFENYLRIVAIEEEKEEEELSPILKRLTGSINLPKDFDYKKALGEAIDEKYGL